MNQFGLIEHYYFSLWRHFKLNKSEVMSLFASRSSIERKMLRFMFNYSQSFLTQAFKSSFMSANAVALKRKTEAQTNNKRNRKRLMCTLSPSLAMKSSNTITTSERFEELFWWIFDCLWLGHVAFSRLIENSKSTNFSSEHCKHWNLLLWKFHARAIITPLHIFFPFPSTHKHLEVSFARENYFC